MSNIKKLTEIVIKFRDERGWKNANNPKDSAISLSLEAAEVLEHFQWKDREKLDEYIKNSKEHIGEELADVLYWILLMSHDLNLDISDALERKMEKNRTKYPIKKNE